jgi:hypothetical protein
MALISERVMNILLGVFIITLAMVTAYIPQLTITSARLQTLLDSPLNIALIAALVFLVTVLNPKVGIVLGFMVVVLAVVLKNQSVTKKIEAFCGCAMKEGFAGDVDAGLVYQDPRTAGASVRPAEIIYREGGVAQGFTDVKSSDGENNLAISNNTNLDNTQVTTKPVVNMSYNNIAPLVANAAPVNYQTSKEVLANADSSHLNAYLQAKMGASSGGCANNTFEFLTQQGPRDAAGWDTVSCRYDSAVRGQNSSQYGPPLAWCAIYDQSKLTKCGTLFYPLNG